MTLPLGRTLCLPRGFLCVPSQPTRLCSIIASGVAVTVFDKRRRFGGVGHYTHPKRFGGLSTPAFAAPALIQLFRMFEHAGSDPRHLETYLYGGGDNPAAPGYAAGRGILNSNAAFEILSKMGVRVSGSDVGGRFARKLVFYTGTGECMLAKVTEADEVDWYPDPATAVDAWGSWTG